MSGEISVGIARTVVNLRRLDTSLFSPVDGYTCSLLEIAKETASNGHPYSQ